MLSYSMISELALKSVNFCNFPPNLLNFFLNFSAILLVEISLDLYWGQHESVVKRLTLKIIDMISLKLDIKVEKALK